MRRTILIIAIIVIAVIAVTFAVMYLVTPKPNVVIMAKPYSEFKICIRTPSGLTTIVVSPRAILEKGSLTGDVKVSYSWRTYYVKTLLPNGTVITIMVKLQLLASSPPCGAWEVSLPSLHWLLRLGSWGCPGPAPRGFPCWPRKS